MGHSLSSVRKLSSRSVLARQKRAKERQNKKRKGAQELFKAMDCESVGVKMIEEECDSEKENVDVSSPENKDTQPPAFTSIAVQTELSMQDIEDLERGLKNHWRTIILCFQSLNLKLMRKGLNFILV